jgi:hypothetical protein
VRRGGSRELSFPLVCRSSLVGAECSPARETSGRAGRSTDKAGRPGTARQIGSGERDQAVYERNQR